MSTENNAKAGTLRPSRDDVEFISYDELVKNLLSIGDVYFDPKYGKLKKIASAGESVRHSMLHKMEQRGMKSFLIKSCVTEDNIIFVRNFLEQYQEANDEITRLDLVSKYTTWFAESFWHGRNNVGSLDLVTALNEQCLFLPSELLETLFNNNIDLYHRSFRVASLLFSLALISGHTDFQFLKELYNTALLFDIGLSSEKFSYQFSVAAKMEQSTQGGGKKYLQDNKVPTEEIEKFLNHPVLSFNEAKGFIEDNYQFPELSKLILIHHETGKLNGFPKAMAEQELLEIECLTVISELSVAFDEFEYSKKDSRGLVKSYFKKFSAEDQQFLVPITRVARLIGVQLENMKVEEAS